MRTLEEKLEELLGPVIESMGYELVAIEMTGSGHGTLRIYIDSPDGITVDDCADVSYQVSGILDVEDPVRGAYTLEISSPGLDRPLVKPAHFSQVLGEEVRVRTHHAVLGRKNFKGRLESFDGNVLAILVDNELYEIPFEDVEKANLVPVFDNERG